MAENADKLQAILRLIKVDVKPGSKWHPVSSAWLRRAQVHAGLEEAHVEDTREAPGKLDNSDIADPIFPMCLRRSASEGVDFVWVPANAFRGLVKLFGVFEGQDPLEREAITDEATFSTKIEAFPQLCKLYACSMASRGEPMRIAPFQGLHRRSSTMSAVKQWALKATTAPSPELGKPLFKETTADQVRLWARLQPPEELAEAGMPTTPGPWRLVDPEAKLEDVAANDHFTDLLLEKFGKCSWPRGNVVQPGQTGIVAVDTAEAAVAGVAGAVPFDEAAWRAGLGVGSRLDAMDSTGQWYEAEVVAAEGDDFTVRFRAWVGAKFNEHIARDSPCLQPLWSHVRNFRSFQPGDNVQVFIRFSDTPALWADAVVIGVAPEKVKVRLASPDITESLMFDKEDSHICAPGIHASGQNRCCTPLAATTGRFTPPPSSAADDGQLVVVEASSSSSAAAAADATPLPPASSSSSGSTAMVRHSRYGLVHSVPGIDDGPVPEPEPEVYTSMPGRYYGGGRSSAPPATAGVCGLQNLGNTCFMNSMLQCLSNSEPLARYFLDERRWRRDLNFDNPLGFKGGLASAYAKLMRVMWQGRVGSVAPSQVKEVVARNAPQFRGYQQHDSQELMSYILDGLHEDCNLVHDKKATEKVESDGRPDAVVAAEAWATHEMRNQSAVQTIFGGQLRSHIQCNTCRNVSLTFDPFTSLSVPIPVPDRVKRVCTVVPHGPGMPTRPSFYPRSELTYVEFEQAARSCRSFAADVPAAGFSSPEAADAAATRGVDDPASRCEFGWAKVANKAERHNRVLQFVHPDEPIRNVADEDFIFSFMLPGRPVSQWKQDRLPWAEEDELDGAAAAGPASSSSSSSAGAAGAAAEGSKAILAGAGAERSGTAGVPTRVRHPAGALLVSLTTELPGAGAAKERAYEFPHVVYLPHVARLEASGGKVEEAFAAPFNADARPSQRAVMAAVWEQVRRHVASSFVDSYSADAPPYTAFLVPARAEPVSGDTSDHRNKTFTAADFAQVGDDGVIALDPRSDEPIPVGGTACARYILRVRFSASGTGAAGTVVVKTRGEYSADSQEFRDHYGRRDRKGAGAITLHDCMDAYVQREQLGQDDKWYCPKCKDFVRAYKKFDLFTVGEVLIVQLKRFRFSNVHTSHYWGTSARRDKISELVDFPTENLDLSSFIMGPQPGPHIFDLYAVSEHSGGLGGGHYTATGRNWLNGKWYDFNDSFVRPARSAQDAVNPSSYVLFFRRRGGAPLRVPLPRHVRPDGSLNAGDPEVARALADAAALRKELEDEKVMGGSA